MPGFDDALPEALLERDLFRATGGALIVLFWEWAITLDDEVNLIWSRSHRSWLKWNFLFARYFIIAVQLLTRALEMAIRYQYELNQDLIRAWYSIQIMAAALAMCSLEIGLMVRVYAIYGQSRRILVLLISLLFIEFVVAITSLAVTLPGRTFTTVNVITRLPGSFAYFGFSALAVQCLILVLTLCKWIKGSMHTVPLVRLMARDGTLTFFAVTVFGLFVAVWTLYHNEYAITAYAWLLTIVSTSACRLTINMLNRATDTLNSEDSAELERRGTTIHFTTVLTERIAFETIDTIDTLDTPERPNRRPWNIP